MDKIKSVVENWVDEDLNQTLLSLKVKITVTKLQAKIVITLDRPYLVIDESLWLKSLKQYVFEQLAIEPKIIINNKVLPRATVAQSKHTKISNIVAVLSGKGGVGKSTITANIAVALSKQGCKVGVLDADIHGPSQLLMLKETKVLQQNENQKFQPMVCNNISFMSMAAFIESGQAVAWRGPIAAKAFVEMYEKTNWPNLDYLIIDCPPGTSDLLLSLSKSVPIVGSVLVTTPQLASVIDADRAADLMHKMAVPILGVVENMSYYQCQNCDHIEHVFNEGGGEFLAEKFNTDCWLKMPLDTRFCQAGDAGDPFSLYDNKLYILAVKLSQSLLKLKKYNKLMDINVAINSKPN